MADRMQRGFASAMAGATQGYKAQLQQQVDPQTYAAVLATALEIIHDLQKRPQPLGTQTAALMLAATAFAEGASQADRLVRESDAK